VNPRGDDAVLAHLRTLVGRELTATERTSVARWVRVYGSDWTEKAVLEARARGKDMRLAYIGGMLRKWGQQGCVCR